MDYKAIEKFVANRFPHLTEADSQELIAEASLFLDELGLSGIDDSIQPGLSAYLTKHRKNLGGANARRAGIRDWREMSLSEIAAPSDTSIPDDETISRIAKRSLFDDPKEIKQEVESSLVEFRRKINKLESLLPLVVFEAFERRLIPETKPKWTTALEPLGLSILYRRARIRMEWKESE